MGANRGRLQRRAMGGYYLLRSGDRDGDNHAHSLGNLDEMAGTCLDD